MKINEKIYKLRKILGISQIQLAGFIKTSCTNISRWETETHRPVGIFSDKLSNLYNKALLLKEQIININQGERVVFHCGHCAKETDFFQSFYSAASRKVLCSKCYFNEVG